MQFETRVRWSDDENVFKASSFIGPSVKSRVGNTADNLIVYDCGTGHRVVLINAWGNTGTRETERDEPGGG